MVVHVVVCISRVCAEVCRHCQHLNGFLYEPPLRIAAGKLSPDPRAPSARRWYPYSLSTGSSIRIVSLPTERCQPSLAGRELVNVISPFPWVQSARQWASQAIIRKQNRTCESLNKPTGLYLYKRGASLTLVN